MANRQKGIEENSARKRRLRTLGLARLRRGLESHSRFLNDVVEHALVLVEHGFPVSVERRVARRPAKRACPQRVIHETCAITDKPLIVPEWAEQAANRVFYVLPSRCVVERDDSKSAGHGFQHDVAKSLGHA